MSTLSENMGLIHAMTRKVWSRVAPFSSELEYGDLEQEACRIYIIAEREFDATKGVKFSTYASNAILRRLNFIADEAIQSARHEYSGSHTDDDGTVVSFVEMAERQLEHLDDTGMGIERQQSFDQVLKKLSPVGRVLFKETFTPSDAMIKCFRQQELRAKQEKKSRNGYFYLNTVASLLVKGGLTEKEVSNAKKEILDLKRGAQVV